MTGAAGLGTAVRMASTGLSMLMGYLFVGGHVQNETLVDEWRASLGPAAAVSDAVLVDPRTGRAEVACIKDACHEQCLWWMHEIGNATDTECSQWTLRRTISIDVLTRALERARACASRAGETCVLSHEVGLQAPAALVWNATKQRMLLYLLPRIVAVDQAADTDGDEYNDNAGNAGASAEPETERGAGSGSAVMRARGCAMRQILTSRGCRACPSPAAR